MQQDELKQSIYAQHDFEAMIFEGKFRTGSVARIVQELRTDNVDTANEQFDMLRESGEGEGDVWYHIVAAYTRSRAGRMLEAKQELTHLVEFVGVESRVKIWAWNKLREWNVEPEEEIANEVIGVVMEVGLDKGIDLMAAYSDGTSRYVSQTGNMIVWEVPEDKNTLLAQKTVSVAQDIVEQIPFAEINAITSKGNVQFVLLTAGGIRTSTTPMNSLSRTEESVLAPLFKASKELLISLIKTVEGSRK